MSRHRIKWRSWVVACTYQLMFECHGCTQPLELCSATSWHVVSFAGRVKHVGLLSVWWSALAPRWVACITRHLLWRQHGVEAMLSVRNSVTLLHCCLDMQTNRAGLGPTHPIPWCVTIKGYQDAVRVALQSVATCTKFCQQQQQDGRFWRHYSGLCAYDVDL
jgi:hypothetical protein